MRTPCWKRCSDRRMIPLRKGVRVFERRDVLQHAKTAVVDGIWSTVGSTNLDYRSFLHAEEANLIIWSREFGSRMETLFLQDQADCKEILLADWIKRPWRNKLMEFISNLFEYWL